MQVGIVRTRDAGLLLASQMDRVMAVLGILITAGTYLDGWAHSTGRTDESFFTPWHAVLYLSWFASMVYLSAHALPNLRRGVPWREVLPTGYGLSLLGAMLFGLGGLVDLLWHTLFGIEASFEALYSPSHLLLGVSGVLIVTGPLRAAWGRTDDRQPTWNVQWPMLVSLLAMFSALTFFTQDMHWIHGFPDAQYRPRNALEFEYLQLAAFASTLLQTVLFMGPVLVAVHRWRLAPGALTVLLGANAVAMGFQDSHYRQDLVMAAVLAGVVGDLLYRWMRPDSQRVTAFRGFAFLLPVAFYGLQFTVLILGDGIWWSVHLWTGAIALAGLAGLLLSLALRPAAPSGTPGS